MKALALFVTCLEIDGVETTFEVPGTCNDSQKPSQRLGKLSCSIQRESFC
jgi:hypothetical protein